MEKEGIYSRILIGLNSDKEIYQAINLNQEFSKMQIDDLKNDFYFMEKIQQLIKNNKLTITLISVHKCIS